MIPENERYKEIHSISADSTTVAMKVYAPVSGTILPLNKVKDPAFSSEILGKGAAIIPNSNEITAPVAGTVSAVYPTKHAYGITGENNEEFLIHIGIDTVKLEGKYFESHVKTGDIIMPGDLIATVDVNSLKNAGYDPTIVVVDTTNTDLRQITLLNSGNVSSKSDMFLVESL